MSHTKIRKGNAKTTHSNHPHHLQSKKGAETVFRIHYRTQFGDFISIRGSGQGLSWSQGREATWVSENGEDIWTLTLPARAERGEGEGEAEERVCFKPLLNDEVWAKGYDYTVKAGDITDVYPFFFSTQGYIFKTSFYSHSLNNTRKLAVYLPPSYDENPFKKYPVILFQDGHNLFDTEDSFCSDTWQIGEAMDGLCCHGGINEYIVVGIYPVQREWEYLPTQSRGGGGADRYLDALVGELRPLVDQHLRTTNSYAIAGSSYGGILAMYAWVTRPDDFDLCGAFSPSFNFDNRVLLQIVKRNLQQRPDDHKLYLDCGTVKDERKSVLEMVDYLQSDGTLRKEQLLFVLAEGQEHSERSWALRAPRALAYLFADASRAQHEPTISENEVLF